MRVINLAETNSILNQYVAEMRDVNVQGDRMRFRRNIERIGELMAYEISKGLDYSKKKIQTPLGIAEASTPDDNVVIALQVNGKLRGTINVSKDLSDSELEQLELAYAITIHKSQGSEFNVVIMALPQAAPMLLTKNLLYTGITRAKKLLIIFGSGNVVKYMINNSDSKKRNTGLKYKLINILK